MSIFEKVATEKASATLSGTRFSDLAGLAGNAAATMGMGMVKSRLPVGVGPKLDMLGASFERAYGGDWQGAGMAALNSGVFAPKLPWVNNAAATAMFQGQKSRASGGVTPIAAQKMVRESLETHFAKKNLFLLSIGQQLGRTPQLTNINLFVTDLSYGPITITADSHKVGSAVLDQPNGTEPIELRLTTMDDEAGSVRKWFDALASAVTHSDGTFGLPAEYLVKISILHSFVDDDSAAYWLRGKRGWKKEMWLRPVSLESELSRKDTGLEEFALVFHQFDTYY